MKKNWFSLLFYFFACVVFSATAWALETDQFTLSPTPLSDSAPLVSRAFFETLRSFEGPAPQDENEIAERFFEAWGKGLPTSHVENWINRSASFSSGARFDLKRSQSIYVHAEPAVILMDLAPTINLYGVLFGTDKLGHFVQQGHEYFTRFKTCLSQGLDEVTCQEKAVAYGVSLERSYFGTMLDGVYSNGDLSANFLGLMFYRHLFETIGFNGEILSPVFILDANGLRMNPEIEAETMLKPFITLHLNEALNSSLYIYSQAAIRAAVFNRCADWERENLFPELDFSESLKTLSGQDYGHNRGYGLQMDLREICGK
jgi:hypothetical protein